MAKSELRSNSSDDEKKTLFLFTVFRFIGRYVNIVRWIYIRLFSSIRLFPARVHCSRGNIYLEGRNVVNEERRKLIL